MKMTERDKVLLVLLVVVLIVALVVVLPGVGVMSCRESISKYENDAKELDGELSDLLDELRGMGVEVAYAERASSAGSHLEDKIFEMKVEASHLASVVKAYTKEFGVDEDWIDGLEYRYAVRSDDGEKLVIYDPQEDVDSTSNGTEINFALEDKEYTLPAAKREIRFLVADDANCNYLTELTMDDYNIKEIGAVLLFMQHISAKGSILITDLTYTIASDERAQISFTVVMPPETSGIATYAQEVLEELARREAEENGETEAE